MMSRGFDPQDEEGIIFVDATEQIEQFMSHDAEALRQSAAMLEDMYAMDRGEIEQP